MTVKVGKKIKQPHFCTEKLKPFLLLKTDYQDRLSIHSQVIFSKEKQTIQFFFLSSLYFKQKRTSKLSIFTNGWTTLFESMTSQTRRMTFLFFNIISRWLSISVTHQPITTCCFNDNVKSLTEIIDRKHYSLVQVSMIFKKTKFALVKSFYFLFKTPPK